MYFLLWSDSWLCSRIPMVVSQRASERSSSRYRFWNTSAWFFASFRSAFCSEGSCGCLLGKTSQPVPHSNWFQYFQYHSYPSVCIDIYFCSFCCHLWCICCPWFVVILIMLEIILPVNFIVIHPMSVDMDVDDQRPSFRFYDVRCSPVLISGW